MEQFMKHFVHTILHAKPEDIVKTFTKTYIPERRIAAKMLRNETNSNKAQFVYRQHFMP